MFLKYLLGLLQVVLSPRRGWEDASYDGYNAAKLFKEGFLPFILLVSATIFVRALMHEEFEWLTLSFQAFVCFLKYFLTYYIAHTVMLYYLPGATDVPMSEKRTAAFLVYTIGILGAINIIANLMPVDTAVVYMLPLYLLIVIWRGTRFMAVKYENRTTFTIASVLSIVFPPILIQLLFNLILKSF